MKAFTSYLTESTRRYEFRIRIAGDFLDDITDKIKQVLEAYKVDSISKPKRLPIKETPEFPNMGPVEVNIIDVSLCYPATDAQVRALIAECGCAPTANIRVTPANSPYEAALAGLEQSNLQKPGESVLMNPVMTTEKADNLVGAVRTNDLMKELSAMRREYGTAEGGKVTDALFQSQGTTNKLPMGDNSPLGSTSKAYPAGKSSAAIGR